MKDLQELFESLGYDEVKWISEMQDKKSLNNASVKTILDYVSQVYCAEKGIEEAELSEEELKKLVEDFQLSATIYSQINDGIMEITGRMRLTDNKCSFRLTKKGLDYASNLIKSMNQK